MLLLLGNDGGNGDNRIRIVFAEVGDLPFEMAKHDAFDRDACCRNGIAAEESGS